MPNSAGTLGFDRVHHRPQVVHPFVQWRNMGHRVRQPCPALVPHDEPRFLGKLLEKCGERGLGLVQQIDVADPSRDPDQRGVPVAQDAIGEPDVAITGVANPPDFHLNSLAVARSPAT